MQNLSILKTLGLGDFRNIQRDSMLAWMMGIPLVTALIMRIGVPPITNWLITTYQFDLTPYYSLITSYLIVLITPILFGFVIGFLLLDERDDQTLIALQVTPLPLYNYLFYRLGLPVLLSFLMNLLIFPIAGLVQFPWWGQLLVSLLAALQAPLFALFLATFAENKVAGFALMKGANAILVFPVISYFFPSLWQHLTGLVPTFWSLKLFWVISEGGMGLIYFLIGLIFQGALLVILQRRFDRVVHR